ncbi:MAG: LPS-assembly protein LptD [Tannerella sp.]|nr:LPS-assembly protein LptD [Tannerella sp.]
MKQKIGWMLFFCIFTGIESLWSQETIQLSDSLEIPVTHQSPDSIPNNLPGSTQTDILTIAGPIPSDSLTHIPDTIPSDSLTHTTDTVPKKPGMLEAPVEYNAKDSIVITARNIAFLYGEGDVKYQQIQLQADQIRMNMDSTVVHANFSVDSLGLEFGYPYFVNGEEKVEAKYMSYNFKTRKAFAKDAITQQGEGFLTADVTKKMDDNSMHIHGGRYTTCDDPNCPHFYIRLTKAKTRPGKNIVAGPAYLVVEDVPLPIALPFAFFPFNKTYSSGIIMPTYGEETTFGFFLRDGGYYFALSDYVDLALRGEFYSKGSWGLSARTSYRKRYKYSGRLDASYIVRKSGDKGFDDYNVTKSFKITWSHQQDAKANPFRTFASSVNFSTGQHDRNDIKGQAMSYATENTKSSSVNITQRFPNSPWSISASMNINQQQRDSTLSVTLPNLMINMSMIAPFKRKNAIGPERWYEKIKLSYTGDLQNYMTSKENVFFKKNLIRDWTNGMNHRIPVSASYSLLNYINITPSFNYQERWYTSKDMQTYDPEIRKLVVDTTLYGFYRVYDYNASVSAGTTLYGFFKPWAIFGGFVDMIRHRMEPSISFSATPDFGDTQYGYHEYYSHRFVNGEIVTGNYSPFERSGRLFGFPGRGKQGSVSFSINNNFEAKVRSNRDSTGLKKISLIDNLSWGMSYNLAADSMKWSPRSRLALRLKLSKSYTLNLNGEFDTYIYAYDEKNKRAYPIDTPRWKVGKGIGRLKSTGTSFSFTFDNNFVKTNPIVKGVRKMFGWVDPDGENSTASNPTNQVENTDPSPDTNPDMPATGTRLLNAQKTQTGDFDYDGYMNASIPWSFNINYSMNLGYDMQKFDPQKMEYAYTIRHSLSFSGNLQPAEKWRINFNGSYDFELKKIPYFTLNVSREMHCFQMSASIVPVGLRKSYMFSIAVSSSLLQDLKYNQSSNYWNGMSWY